MYGPRIHHYEFEGRSSWETGHFEQVLEAFRINPEEVVRRAPWEGNCYISFWCTKKVRQRIEYVYRRLMSLPVIMLNTDEYLNNQEKFYKDGYYIL